MKFDIFHQLNKKVVNHKKKSNAPAIASPDSHPDPYLHLGSHPETVRRVWDGLGGSLPEDCRAIVYGTPALVEPKSGVIIAMSYGTAYALRVPIALINVAHEAGCEAERKWTGGSKTNIEETLGQGWVFGAWINDEIQWVLDVYNELQKTR